MPPVSVRAPSSLLPLLPVTLTTTNCDAVPLIVTVWPFPIENDGAVKTFVPGASSTPDDALMVVVPLIVTAVPASAPKEDERLFAAEMALETLATLEFTEAGDG